MESSDVLMMKSLIDRDGMSDYEQSMLAHKQSCRPNGTSVAAITIGGAALLAAVGAWVFGGVYANAKACGNAQLIGANQAHTQQMLTLLASNAANERSERINQLNLSNKTIVDINKVDKTSQILINNMINCLNELVIEYPKNIKIDL